ncbi:hypothetical protein PHMEG_0005585 [Phytophthora megakarya]|uniref:Uncharacterized protein n=1 Tax=Phytophthora megakarya TaxID=4795 RepID=A0A225WQR6_9STRA|nr:hypothetical protein PHMEG_0005585 [Phytophthora megakarya]
MSTRHQFRRSITSVTRTVYDDRLHGDGGLPQGENAASSRTKHCMNRFLNILFSVFNELQSDRRQSISRLNERSPFWQDVKAAYVQVYETSHERNLLAFRHELFKGVDPSIIRPHSEKKLYDMSKELLGNYFVAEHMKMNFLITSTNPARYYIYECGLSCKRSMF